MCECGYYCETEEQNSFWADVYYYMEENQCNQEEAIKAISPVYNEQAYEKSDENDNAGGKRIGNH